jgi:hypothetical protein
MDEGLCDNELKFVVAETGEIAISLTSDPTQNDAWTVWRSFKIERLAPAVTTYAVNIADHQNGTVEADKTTAAEGETVNVTVTPAEGYMVDEAYWTVGEEKHEFEEPEEGNQASFTMPAGDVTITVVFKVAPTEYQGVIEQTVTNAAGAQMGETTVTDQTLAIAEAGENKVDIIFKNGFTWPVGMPIPELTIKDVVVSSDETGALSYTFDGTATAQQGMYSLSYEVSLRGYQASENDTPVFHITQTSNSRMTDDIYFGADADAIAAYKQAVGIKNVKGAQNVGTIYDLSGRKVEKMVKGGIYIVNGKKVSFK